MRSGWETWTDQENTSHLRVRLALADQMQLGPAQQAMLAEAFALIQRAFDGLFPCDPIDYREPIAPVEER